MAKDIYQQGLALMVGEEGSEVKAMMQRKLGNLEYTLGDRDEAVEWLEKAKASYLVLGEEVQVEYLTKWINFILGRD